MSKATKRKHVVKEVLDDFILPEEPQQIVQISASRGNNLHEAVTATGDKFLVSMPTKFRKNVWIKRGDFVIVVPIDEGDKVKAEIAHILYKDKIKYIMDEGKWPEGFSDGRTTTSDAMIPDDMLPPSGSDSDEEALGDRVVNTNRPTVTYDETSSEEEAENEDR